MKKLLLTLAAVLVIGGGAAGYTVSHQQPEKQSVVSEQKKDSISYKGVEGKNALELLKSKYKVETKEYSGMGEMVTSINDVKPDSKHFWGFYINGESAQVGADAYQTKP